MPARHTLVVLLTAVVGCALGQSNTDLTYARIKYKLPHANGTVDTLEQMSGVYALYSPSATISGILVIANPLDGCTPTTLPVGLNPKSPFVLLTRLDSSSGCSPLEQALLAESSGATGVINMAPTRSSFIYLLEKRATETSRPDPTIPQIAISGSSGYRLLTATLTNPAAIVTITGPTDIEEEESTIDLIIAVACMVVALIVLAYAFRVGRTLCQQPAQFAVPEESIEDLEERKNKVKQLLMELPIKPYEGEGDADDVCAICLEQFEIKEEVRVLRCNHFFHVDCIDPWLLNKANCPLCKDEVLDGVDFGDFLSAPPTSAQPRHTHTNPVATHDRGLLPVVQRRSYATRDERITQIELGAMDSGRRNTLARHLSSEEHLLSAAGGGIYLPQPDSTMLPAISASSLDPISTKPALSACPSNSSLPQAVADTRRQRFNSLNACSQAELDLLIVAPPGEEVTYDVAEVGSSAAAYDECPENSSVIYDNVDMNGGEQSFAMIEMQADADEETLRPLTTRHAKRSISLSRPEQQTSVQLGWGMTTVSSSDLESMHSFV